LPLCPAPALGKEPAVPPLGPILAPPLAGSTLAADVHRVYRRLAALERLDPGPEVDALFGRLVALATRAPLPDDDLVLRDPVLRAIAPRLHLLCARGETALERRWAGTVATSADPAATLRAFPYHANYRQLVRLEWHAMVGATGRPPHRVAFVGSGPLPLSALLLATHHGVRVEGIARDGDAVTGARRVTAALGVAGVTFRAEDVLASIDLDGYDAVVVAALVGLDADAKRRILDHLAAHLRPGALLVARSAHGTRALLYPEIDLAAVAPFELLAVLHPYGPVINSVVLARQPGGDG
jgi:hypothetical protein